MFNGRHGNINGPRACLYDFSNERLKSCPQFIIIVIPYTTTIKTIDTCNLLCPDVNGNKLLPWNLGISRNAPAPHITLGHNYWLPVHPGVSFRAINTGVPQAFTIL